MALTFAELNSAGTITKSQVIETLDFYAKNSVAIPERIVNLVIDRVSLSEGDRGKIRQIAGIGAQLQDRKNLFFEFAAWRRLANRFSQ